MSLNKVMLIGNVGRDPEVRYLENQSQNGVAPKVASFTLATSERFRDRNGEVRENTEWHNIVAWRQLADLCDKFVRKGTQLYIEGRLRTRSWDDQTGNKRYTTEVIADTIQLLGKKGDNPAAGDYQAAAPQQPAAQPARPQQAYQPAPQPAAAAPAQDAPVDIMGGEDDDLPF